ncbi:MAG: phenylpyruvate tautomerase MIF-related protein [Gammaproteobacteria bacterium]|nr:phenylpyruvate tautomerase MIF-related protein [Gammaproteobacteria bacterium]
MPLLTLNTNQPLDDKTGLCQKLSRHTAEMLGKPESYVMVIVRDDQSMIFAGTDEPTALLELKSLGLPEDQTTGLSDSLCTLVNGLLNIPTSRIYIEFSSPARHMWGRDKRTF